jgi:hypothetical protein
MKKPIFLGNLIINTKTILYICHTYLKTIVLVLVLFAVLSAADILYSVVSLTNRTHTMGVLVDNQMYPLYPTEQSSILHIGNAPVAKKGYSYIVLEGRNVISKEGFPRSPSSSDTQNEYYNRSWNKWDLKKLPIVLPKLPIINRMESDLHIDGEIPTIHFVGNQDTLDKIHKNQLNNDLSVDVKMTYIRQENIIVIYE